MEDLGGSGTQDAVRNGLRIDRKLLWCTGLAAVVINGTRTFFSALTITSDTKDHHFYHCPCSELSNFCHCCLTIVVSDFDHSEAYLSGICY